MSQELTSIVCGHFGSVNGPFGGVRCRPSQAGSIQPFQVDEIRAAGRAGFSFQPRLEFGRAGFERGGKGDRGGALFDRLALVDVADLDAGAWFERVAHVGRAGLSRRC